MSVIQTTRWTRVEDQSPPDGQVVQTRSAGGLEQRLKRNGRLWFTEDGRMYVYYVPMWWAPVEENQPAAKG